MSLVNILEAIDDEQFFARWFHVKEAWAAWRAFLAALFGLPLTDEQLKSIGRAQSA
jgi:hypothetical protein